MAELAYRDALNQALAEEMARDPRVFLMGEEVARPMDEVKEAGKFNVEFSADELPSGTYIYRMDAGNFSASKRMVLLK